MKGRKLTARIESVFLRGTQVVKDHQVVVEKGREVCRSAGDMRCNQRGITVE